MLKTIIRSQRLDHAVVGPMERNPALADRLRPVPGVGLIIALERATEIGESSRFRTIKQATSHCWRYGEVRSSVDEMRFGFYTRMNSYRVQVSTERLDQCAYDLLQ